ncbi:MAG TPA: prenyltransferase/squalene oxidase repeat-containing protein, partial [Pirellulales bacterium]|nr:prenyltransferase/squalene oxidase repeat-containing protein [Pirellulales bacterium]
MDAAKEAGFDPYYRWLGIPRSEQPPSLYRLLGLTSLEPDLGVIEEAADRQMAHVRAHHNGPYVAESQRLLNELAAARSTLLHVGKKLAYDRTLRPPMPPPPPPETPRVAAPARAPSPRPVPVSSVPIPIGIAAPVAVSPGAYQGANSPRSPINVAAPRPPETYQGLNAPRSPANGAADRAPAAPSPAAPRPVPVPLAVKADPSKLVLRETPANPDDELKRFALKKAPPWAISCVIHMLLLIILGLWYIAPEAIHNGIFLDIASPELGQQLDDASFDMARDDANQEQAIVAPADLSKVDDPFAETKPEKLEIDLMGSQPIADLSAPTIEVALMGREPGTKEALLGKYGGNGQSEDAVTRGLAWLAKQQRKDGHWSLKGPYASGALDARDLREAATAMALLAFQGAGHTHLKGDYQKEVKKGIDYLVRNQEDNGSFFQGGSNNNWFYAHAQCTMAICELYGMTKDKKLREHAV